MNGDTEGSAAMSGARRLAIIPILLFLCACSAIDRLDHTEFKPIGQSAFEYKAIADVLYPEDSESAEAKRHQWLERYLADNGLCPNGYEITQRRAVHRFRGLLGTIVDIFYVGRCKS